MQEQNSIANKSQDIEFEKQLEERISEMEDNGYTFPTRMSKKDYLFASIVALVCLVLIIVGGAL